MAATPKYRLEKLNFDGPLDLLLSLIDKNKVDIYDIPIVEITDQYLAYVGSMEDNKRKYEGRVVWISPEAEFVPTAVQTQNERENLVYAVKVHVKNDGLLRVGMYADVKL